MSQPKPTPEWKPRMGIMYRAGETLISIPPSEMAIAKELFPDLDEPIVPSEEEQF